jgi:hypothetical protein
MEQTKVITNVLPSFLSGEYNTMGQITKKPKGTKIIAGTLIVSVVGVLGYGFVKYALPLIMSMISPVIAGILGFAAVAFAFAMAKPVWKWFTAIANKVYKAAIRYNPDVAVENQLKKLDDMSALYSTARAKLKLAIAQFIDLANTSQAEVDKIQRRLTGYKKELDELQKKKAAISKKVDSLEQEVKAKKRSPRDEEYLTALRERADIINKINTLTTKISTDSMIYPMKKNLTESSAAKASIFTKWDLFLGNGACIFENRKIQLETWWDAIKKELPAAQAGRDATDALKLVFNINGSSKTVDFQVAVEAIEQKLNTDYAITVQNMSDLERCIDSFGTDSNSAEEKLEELLEQFENGDCVIPVEVIASPAHVLSMSERNSAGVLGHLFNEHTIE